MDDLPLRCTCSTRPLLAIARPIDGRWLLHLRVHKQHKVYGEMVVEEGVVRIRCRACARWYLVRVRREKVSSKPEDLPRPLAAFAG